MLYQNILINLSLIKKYKTMKSGFVELVVKKVIGGRTVKLQQKAKRFRAIDAFKKYLNTTLPQMQQSTQINLLKKSLPKIKSPSIRKQLINSYLRRLFRLRMYQKQQIKNYKIISDPQPQAIPTIIDPTIIKNINLHTQYDVGSYCLYNQDDMRKVFKNGCFGRYSEQEWACSNKFGIQIREECISIGAVMKIIMKRLEKQKKKQGIKWEIFKDMPQKQIKQQYIENETAFPQLFMQLSHQIYLHAQSYRNHPQYTRVWGSSVITDIITNSILQSASTNLANCSQIAKQVVDAVMKIQPLPSPNDFSYRNKKLPETEIQTKIQLPFQCRFYSNVPSFRSIFLGGQGGNGRSMILTYLAMLAYKNNWIVVNVPNVYNWTQKKRTKYVRAYNGLFLINQQAVQWLDQFLTANKNILEKRQVVMDNYGKCDITGTSQLQAQPVPNTYLKDRKTYFNEISDKFTNRLPQQQEQLRQQAKKRLTFILKTPKSLAEICVAGIKNPQYATCAMGEVLHQLTLIQDIPILQCVDSYSYLFRASAYPSFRYYNDRDLWGRIPPYHIAHCRLFICLDGHKYRHGLKIVAASNYPMYMHKFNIKQMMFPLNYEHKVRNLNPKQFKNAAQFNILNQWWPADQVQRGNLMYAYTLTQGNWGDFQQLMRQAHYY